MRLDMLYAHAADLGVNVEHVDLGPVRRGDYCAKRNLIRLHIGLTRAQATSTLAHEIGHATFGDSCSTPFTERRAWQYGAALIITPADYCRAEQIAGPHAAAIAAELGVTPQLIKAWRDWARRHVVLSTHEQHWTTSEPI